MHLTGATGGSDRGLLSDGPCSIEIINKNTRSDRLCVCSPQQVSCCCVQVALYCQFTIDATLCPRYRVLCQQAGTRPADIPSTPLQRHDSHASAQHTHNCMHHHVTAGIKLTRHFLLNLHVSNFDLPLWTLACSTFNDAVPDYCTRTVGRCECAACVCGTLLERQFQSSYCVRIQIFREVTPCIFAWYFEDVSNERFAFTFTAKRFWKYSNE